MKIIELSQTQEYLEQSKVTRQIKTIHIHHTYLPDYERFFESGHITLMKNMKRYHMKERGFSDIAQHFSPFPDGKIGLGRSLNKNPASIKYNNRGAIVLECIGNFDEGNDIMSDTQADCIINLVSTLSKFFKVPLDTDHILYHHWFDRDNGKRTNGLSGNVKTCPGSSFFGGNKVENCENDFLSLIREAV